MHRSTYYRWKRQVDRHGLGEWDNRRYVSPSSRIVAGAGYALRETVRRACEHARPGDWSHWTPETSGAQPTVAQGSSDPRHRAKSTPGVTPDTPAVATSPQVTCGAAT